jgi:hypothetical protein
MQFKYKIVFFKRKIFVVIFMEGVVCVRRCGYCPPDQEWSRMVWEERIRNSCLLLVERGNESRHLVFWSLGILTGLRVWEKGLIA